jgi:hypothetical protein
MKQLNMAESQKTELRKEITAAKALVKKAEGRR